MSNKDVVLAFYRDVFNGHDTSKVAQYVRPDYIQHNPTVEDGLAGFQRFIEFFVGMGPTCDIIRCDEAGDLVYVFFRCTLANGVVNKVMDVYRLEDGLLAEHWDVVEHDVAQKEREAVNPNGIW